MSGPLTIGMISDQSFIDRFWSRVSLTANPDKCWIWQGSVRGQGYGHVSHVGRTMPAHRVALVLSGRDIAEGMHTDHICRVRKCVNPLHLRAVTPRVNALENSLSISALNHAKTHCARGHLLAGDNLRPRAGERRVGHRECMACRRQTAIAYRPIAYQKRKDQRRAQKESAA